MSLVGVNGYFALAMRYTLMALGVSARAILMGCMGFDSPETWELRDKVKHIPDVLRSLAGVSSKKAWDVRREWMDHAKQNKNKVILSAIATSLRGLDSLGAWKMRAELVKAGVLLLDILYSVTALNSPEAWKVRRAYLNSGYFTKRDVAYTLAGLDSPEAWQLRQEWLDMGVNATVIASSLAGLDSPRARKLRERLFLKMRAEAADSYTFADSLNGNALSSIWRLRLEPFSTPPETKIPLSREVEDKLEMLNLVHAPSQEKIAAYRKEHPLLPPRDALSLSPFAIDKLVNEGFQDPETARAFLETNPAVADRAVSRLAKQLMRRMVPTFAQQPSAFSRFINFFKPKKRLRVPLSQAFRESHSMELVGGGSDNLKDHRRILEAREPTQDTLLASDAYGAFNRETQRWEKVYFPVQVEFSGPTRVSTFALMHVQEAGRVTLRIPIEARLITERVRGLNAKDEEVSLQPEVNSLGEATVDVPSDVVRIVYSVERPVVPEPIQDVSERTHASFVKTFERDHGHEMFALFARLPHGLQAEIGSAEFKALSPKQKVIRIEQMVREVSWYDERNEDTKERKQGKTPEEQIVICEARCEELKTKGIIPKTERKMFAGVCADFAQITCALLRAAGMPAGIQRATHLQGTSAEMSDEHAVAFTPWPDGQGGIRLLSVDGTPASVASRAAGVFRLSLAEREAGVAESTKTEVEAAHKTVAEAVEAAQAGDETTLRELQNGKLEIALNTILRYEVKRPHLAIVKAALDVYRYGRVERLDGVEAEIYLRQVMEEAVARERAEQARQGEPSRTEANLLEMIREFTRRYQRERKDASRGEALQVVDRILELAHDSLDPVERRAVIAAVGYLKAERVGR